MIFPKPKGILPDVGPRPPYLLSTFTHVPQHHLPNPATPNSAMCHAFKTLLSTTFWYTMLAIAIIALIHTIVALLVLCAYACRVEGGAWIILFLAFVVLCTIFGMIFFLFLCGIDVLGIDEAMPWVD